MNGIKSTSSTLWCSILFRILVLIGFLPGCQTTKEKTQTEKPINPNGRFDVWDFIGSRGGGVMLALIDIGLF